VREFPFESARQRMSTIHTLPSGALEVLTKGAPEAILRACTRFRQHDRTLPLQPQIRVAVQADVERLAADGLRVLAFARRELPGPELPSPHPRRPNPAWSCSAWWGWPIPSGRRCQRPWPAASGPGSAS
jgi:magnesium-transporting ATPase (P-type)